MRIPRIYLPLPLKTGSEVQLDENAMRHAVRVLRLKSGHNIILFNGDGGEYQAEILSIEKRSATVRILEFYDKNIESSLYTHLALGISKGERMDYAIQKAVELGVNQITPLYTEHCVVQLNNQREAKRTEHWRSIICSACEQCGRNTLPHLNPPLQFRDFVSGSDSGTRLILEPEAGQAMNSIVLDQPRIQLCVGPEGGFSRSEIEMAKENSFLVARLGPRVMRTETAAIMALGVIQTLWGDLTD